MFKHSVANNEGNGIDPQIYRAQNAYILNGNLILEMKNEPYLGYFYTSGGVETNPLYYLNSGYFESRIKLPYGNGFWPTFWTQVGAEPWSYEEIDIFEMVPGEEEYCHRDNDEHILNTLNTMTSNVHTHPPCFLCDGINCEDNPLCNCDDPYSNGSISLIQDYTQWHTYGIEWSPSRIIWYVDDYPVRYYQNSQIVSFTRIILNFALKPGFAAYGSLPALMYVDYVKVYELKKACNDFIDATNYDFSTYNNVEKNYIKIGEGGGNNYLSVGDDVTIRASQFVDIYGDFYVPLGASFYMDASKDCTIDLGRECSLEFNPCSYDFSNYDNSVKKIIELGGNACSMNITPMNNDVVLQATDQIILKPGVTITPTPGKSIELKIISCQ